MSGLDDLHVSHRVAAPPEAVWDAWTTASGLARWWWSGWADTRYDVDARVGGRYRITAPAAGISVAGEYLALDPPRRIEMTWVWSDDDGDGPIEHVVVELLPGSPGTIVEVHHRGPWATPEPSENYRQGWEHVLGRLAEVLLDARSDGVVS